MGNSREIAFVAIASLLFLGGFMAISFMDRSHGDIGSGYSPDDVVVTIGETTGAIEVPQLPDGLQIFGAGQSASMEFNVANKDRDNDIDTIVVTIPDASITNSSYAWGEPSESHLWNVTMEGDSIIFTADTDFPGLNHGGSAQYDTAGNEDDALDYDDQLNASESITVTVDFTAPTTPGLKFGADAIDLEVADLKTENANGLASFDPFPYPYIVGDTGDVFIVMILDSDTAGLGVSYDGTLQFASTRASMIKTFDHGMEYVTDDGRTVAVLEKPSEGTVVKPVILPSSGSIGTFSLTVFDFTLTDVATGSVGTVPVVTGYTETPLNMNLNWDLDIDSDGMYNGNDDDIDGDTYLNAEDPAPYDPSVFNTPPTGATAVADRTSVEEGESFTLSAAATDPDMNTLTYTWTCEELPSWTQSGKTVLVRADGAFVPGTYKFTVKVSDGISSTTTSDDITVTVNEKTQSEGKISTLMIILVIIITVTAIVVLVYFFVVREREEVEDEQPMEMGPEPTVMAEPPSIQVETETEIGATDDEVQITQDKVISAPVAPAPPSQAAHALTAPDESEDVQELEQLIEDLEKTEEEISDLCPECGSPLGAGDTTCPSCGTEFELALECPNCGSMVEDKSTNCPSCGIQFI
jgi:hypothetical protein